MATLSKTFTFDADEESWVATRSLPFGPTPEYGAYGNNSTNGWRFYAGGEQIGAGYIEWTGTWADLFGIDAGSTVDTVTTTTATDWKVDALFPPVTASSPTGFTLRDSGGDNPIELISTFSSPTTTSWATKNADGAESVNELASTTIKLRIDLAVEADEAWKTSQMSIDNIVIEVEYTPIPKKFLFAVK